MAKETMEDAAVEFEDAAYSLNAAAGGECGQAEQEAAEGPGEGPEDQ
jgi:hypothetical protein